MSTRNLRRTVLALVAVATLTLLPAVARAAPHAAPRTGGPGVQASGSSLLSWAWSLLQSVWGAEGASLDPNGVTKPGDEGGSLDPDGLRSPGDEGGSLDPNG